MTCTDCEIATKDADRIAYYRIGNKDLGWGEIGLIGCSKHVKLALDKLNSSKSFDIDVEKLQKLLEK